jgi:hypothetical protein
VCVRVRVRACIHLSKVISHHQYNYSFCTHFYLVSICHAVTTINTRTVTVATTFGSDVSLASTSEVCISYTLSLPTTGNYVFRDTVQIFYSAYFTFKISYILQYKHKPNYLYAYKKNTDLLVPMFTKLTNTQQHYV